MAKVKGTKAVKAAIRRAPAALRDEALVEVRRSTQAMHQDAVGRFASAGAIAPFHHGKAGMQSISGTVRRNYRWSVSKLHLRGRVGLLSASAASRAYYLRFFNDGTVNQPARPIHDEAFEAEREIYIQRQNIALDRVLRKVFQ